VVRRIKPEGSPRGSCRARPGPAAPPAQNLAAPEVKNNNKEKIENPRLKLKASSSQKTKAKLGQRVPEMH
jgi:hypothetical protein